MNKQLILKSALMLVALAMLLGLAGCGGYMAETPQPVSALPTYSKVMTSPSIE